MSEVTFKQEEGTRYIGDARFTKEEYISIKEKVLNKLKSSKKIDGFRPGKVPVAIIEKKFADDVKLSTAIDTLYAHVDNFAKTAPHGIYKITNLKHFDFVGDILQVSFFFDSDNIVEFGKLKGITLEEHFLDDKDKKELNRELENLRDKYIQYKDKVDEDNLVITKDTCVSLDIEFWQAGAPLGEVQKNIPVILGRYNILPGEKELSQKIEDFIIESKPKVGSELKYKEDVSAVLKGEAKDEVAKSIEARKDLEVVLKIQGLKEYESPTLDDNFVEKYLSKMGLKTKKELESYIKDSLKTLFCNFNISQEVTKVVKEMVPVTNLLISDSYYKERLGLEKSDLLKIPEEQRGPVEQSIKEQVLLNSVIQGYLKDLKKEYFDFFSENMKKLYLPKEAESYISLFLPFIENRIPESDAIFSRMQERVRETDFLIAFSYFRKKSMVKKGRSYSYQDLLALYKK